MYVDVIRSYPFGFPFCHPEILMDPADAAKNEKSAAALPSASSGVSNKTLEAMFPPA